ncbi:MAG: extracellular solute-binding protein [Propionibacteriaceae bacterium]|jgi:multiple sugar transport system substrate-binding protein/raffinose/stachyose/melibiose transport system substrate-binding protein|nr:extracellular solute-binding protein [Propionibacteriaceae bacterium]
MLSLSGNLKKTTAGVAAVLALTLGFAGCSSGSGSSGETSAAGGSETTTTQTSEPAAESVTMTFWHNGTGEKATTYWENTVKDFEAANPGVTIEIQVVQNEDLDGKLQTAMQAGTTPDIFLQRGGGKMAEMLAAGQVMDITDLIDADIKAAYGEGAFGFDSLNGRIYAMPMSVQPEGLWYNQDLFDQAGITTNPTDMASFNEAVATLKAAGIQAVALGAQDAWPAAHWFYSFALRECSKDVIDNLTSDKKFDDPCWLKAFQDVADLNATNPWNQGFLTTVAQQGAGSSAGLVANGQAAMELMGSWEPGVIGGLTPDGENLASLRWFAFPAVDGGQGDPTAIMGGSDGYSCSAAAPPACVDFLNFIAQKEYSEGYADAYSTLPANSEAMGVVTDPSLKAAAEAYSQAAYAVLWFDTSLGQDVGNAVNNAVVTLLAGQVDAAGALQLMQAAVAAG